VDADMDDIIWLVLWLLLLLMVVVLLLIIAMSDDEYRTKFVGTAVRQILVQIYMYKSTCEEHIYLKLLSGDKPRDAQKN
jgi:hypothetical protein